jgi:hypothetical protein
MSRTSWDLFNITTVLQLLFLDELALAAIFWPGQQLTEGIKITILNIRSYLRKLARNHALFPGKVKVTYRLSKRFDPVLGFERSRNFAQTTSQQGLKSEIRAVLPDGLVHDIDFRNCHFAILKHVCDIEAIPCPLVTDYVNRCDELRRPNPKRIKRIKAHCLQAMYCDLDHGDSGATPVH